MDIPLLNVGEKESRKQEKGRVFQGSERMREEKKRRPPP